MPEVVVRIKWDYPDEKFWLPPESIAMALHAYCRNTNFKVIEEKLSGSEALFGFCAWLLSRKDPITLSEQTEAPVVIALLKLFLDTNELEGPVEGWQENLIYPTKGDNK